MQFLGAAALCIEFPAKQGQHVIDDKLIASRSIYRQLRVKLAPVFIDQRDADELRIFEVRKLRINENSHQTLPS
jgi:hypothetical protein